MDNDKREAQGSPRIIDEEEKKLVKMRHAILERMDSNERRVQGALRMSEQVKFLIGKIYRLASRNMIQQ